MMLEMESVQDSMRGSMMGSVQVRKCSQFQKYLDTLRELMHLVSCSPFFAKRDNFCDFLFALLHANPLLKMGRFKEERICFPWDL